MCRGCHPIADVRRVQPHPKVPGILKVQLPQGVLNNVFQVEEVTPLGTDSQLNSSLARAKGGVRREEKVTTRGAMFIAGAMFTAVFNPPILL